MKKLAILLAALMAVAFAAPAFAADNLELSGQFWVRGWDISNDGYTDGNDASFFDQRMRLMAKIKASDNAYVVIRTDLGEGVWGSGNSALNGMGGGFGTGLIARPDETTEVQIDRLYGVYNAEMWELTAGLQYLGLGIKEVVDIEPTAFKLRLKLGAVEPSLIYAKIDEGTSIDDDADAEKDGDLYALNVSFDLAGFGSNVYYAYYEDDSVDIDQWVLGFMTAGKLGIVNLTAEIDFFGGENDTTNVDYVGWNFYLKGEVPINDVCKVGAEFLYAPGTDEADEDQISNIGGTTFGGFNIMDANSPAVPDIALEEGDDFELTADGGIIGFTLFGDYKVTEDLSFGAKIGYFEPEEDENTLLDDKFAFLLWGNYALGSNTSVCLAYLQELPDTDAVNDEDIQTVYAKFQINF